MPRPPREQELTKTGIRLLEFIFDFSSSNQRYPGFDEVADGFLVKGAPISKNYLNTLIMDKERVGPKFVQRTPDDLVVLTKYGEKYIRSLRDITILPIFGNIPFAEVPVYGQVRAGDRAGDLEEDLYTGPGMHTEPVPVEADGGQRAIYQVIGGSMVHEAILEGDYIIVRPSEDPKAGFTRTPGERELVAARYLAPRYNELPEEEIQFLLDDSRNLRGPTLKYFSTVPRKSGKEPQLYRLSWQKEASTSPEMILTRAVVPVGRIVGLFRRYERYSG